MNHFHAADFSECHSEEVMFLLTLSLESFQYNTGVDPGFSLEGCKRFMCAHSHHERGA